MTCELNAPARPRSLVSSRTADRVGFSASRVSTWSIVVCVATAETALVTAREKGEDARTRAIAFWIREAAMSSIAFVIFFVV